MSENIAESAERDDGGSAFPIIPPVDETGRTAVGYPYPESGMSLRDWFASMAPATPETFVYPDEPELRYTRGPHNEPVYDDQEVEAYRRDRQEWFIRRTAAWRWAYADAMLAERSK